MTVGILLYQLIEIQLVLHSGRIWWQMLSVPDHQSLGIPWQRRRCGGLEQLFGDVAAMQKCLSRVWTLRYMFEGTFKLNLFQRWRPHNRLSHPKPKGEERELMQTGYDASVYSKFSNVSFSSNNCQSVQSQNLFPLSMKPGAEESELQ